MEVAFAISGGTGSQGYAVRGVLISHDAERRQLIASDMQGGRGIINVGPCSLTFAEARR